MNNKYPGKINIIPGMITMPTYMWTGLHVKICEELGPAAAISWVLKRELGFTARFDYGITFLDFYDERMQTFFQMKYL